MYRAAIRSIFSELLRQERLVAIENPVLEKPKTKDIAKFLNDFSLSKVLIITDEIDVNFFLSIRNIPNVDVITVREINPVVLLKSHKVAVTAEAFKQIVQSGEVESKILSWKDTVDIMKSMDTVRSQIGLKYPFED